MLPDGLFTPLLERCTKMKDAHASAAEMASLIDGEPSSLLAQHLFACPECWRQASDVLCRIDSGNPGIALRQSLSTREPLKWALLERYRLEQTRLEESLAAQAAVAEVRGLNRRQRRELVARTKDYHTLFAVEGLLTEARAANVPYEGEEWAGLAIVACHQIPPSGIREIERTDTLAECYAELAATRRRSARWQLARDAVRQGRECLAKGSGNAYVEGHLLHIEGCIEGDCGLLERAEQLLSQATACFTACGVPRLAAKSTIQAAYVFLDVAPAKTLEFLKLADPMIPAMDRRLAMFAESIRVDALVTLGAAREAMRRFEALCELYDQFGDPFVQLRRRFTAGRLLEAVGRYDEADKLFNEVIAADLEQRSNKSFFLDLVYLLHSHLRRGDIAGSVSACERALAAISLLDLDDASQTQMREVWNGLLRHLQRGATGLEVIVKARQFIKTQWRTVGGDALLIKESAV